MDPDKNPFNAKDNLNKVNLQFPVSFNIIHIDDISKSKISKLEEWKRYKDPNEVGVDRLNRGAQAQRLITEINVNEDEANPTVNTASQSIYKLTLKDNFDNYCFAYEYEDKLPFLRAGSDLPIPIRLGGKLIIEKNTPISNGALLINRNNCRYLGIDENSDLVKTLNSNLVEKSINILQNPGL